MITKYKMEKNKNMGKYVTKIAENGSVVCYCVDTTDIVNEAEKIHKTSAVVTAALGRLMTATSLIGANLKGKDDSVTLRIKADGPIGALIAVSDSNGDVKGYVQNPVVELPLNKYGKLDVSGAVGKDGTLYVIKDLGFGEPYVGMNPLVSGEIAEDVTSYFATSEQIPTVCALGVLVNPDLSVKSAGGFIAQLLPGAMDCDIDILEKNINSLDSVTQMLEKGLTPEDIADRVLEGFAPQLLDIRNVEYRCDCSRERVKKALFSLSDGDLNEIITEDKKAELLCHFCNKKYNFDLDELLAIQKEKKEKPEEDK